MSNNFYKIIFDQPGKDGKHLHFHYFLFKSNPKLQTPCRYLGVCQGGKGKHKKGGARQAVFHSKEITTYPFSIKLHSLNLAVNILKFQRLISATMHIKTLRDKNKSETYTCNY